MKIIPAIDLQDGRVVHARGGDRKRYQALNTEAFPSSQPLDVVRRLCHHSIFYLADLDSIAGHATQSETLWRIQKALPKATLWSDQGIRDIGDYHRVRAEVPGMPVIGSETLAGADILEGLNRAGNDYILSLDFDGTTLRGPSTLLAAADDWPDTVIVLALDAVGSGRPKTDLCKSIRALAPRCALAYGGGVRNKSDLRELEAIGADYALVANALYQSVIV